MEVALLLLFAAMGALFWVLGRGMLTVQPNRLYGVRTGATFADDRVWRDTNDHSGRWFMRLGLGQVAATAAAWVLFPPETALLVLVVVATAATAWLCVDAVRYGQRRLAHYRALDARDGRPASRS